MTLKHSPEQKCLQGTETVEGNESEGKLNRSFVSGRRMHPLKGMCMGVGSEWAVGQVLCSSAHGARRACPRNRRIWLQVASFSL